MMSDEDPEVLAYAMQYGSEDPTWYFLAELDDAVDLAGTEVGLGEQCVNCGSPDDGVVGTTASGLYFVACLKCSHAYQVRHRPERLVVF